MIMQAQNEMKWCSCGTTHTGMTRNENQDAFVNLQEQGLWVVADGMGGHLEGDFASSRIVNALKQLESEKSLGKMVRKIYQRLNEVNQMLREQAAGFGKNQVIGSTVAILYAKRHAFVSMWSGDSRIYLFRRGKLRQLTQDHNNESNLLAAGISPADLHLHPYAQTLTHAIGGEKAVYLDAQIQEARVDDVFLLCSDGLNREVSDMEIEEVLRQMTYREAMDCLLDKTLQRGARDNVTLILVKVSKL